LPPGSGAGSPQTIPSGSVAISAEARALQLANQLVQARHDLSSAQADLRNARSERDALRTELARARARIDELEVVVELEPDGPPPAAVAPELERELRSRIEVLEAELVAARAAAVAAPLGDLKLVKGIGPKIEKALKAQGVTEVRQIAAWSAEDIEAIAKKIGVQSARIKKDDWVGAAKRLADAS
jgi:predicted flap endonuclease-1-like 5' DNA nuclease